MDITVEEFDKLPFEEQLMLYKSGELPESVKDYIQGVTYYVDYEEDELNEFN